MTQGYEGNKQEDVTEIRYGKKPTSNSRAALEVTHYHLPSRRNLIFKLQALKIQPCFWVKWSFSPAKDFTNGALRTGVATAWDLRGVLRSSLPRLPPLLPPLLTTKLLLHHCVCVLCTKNHDTVEAVSSLRVHNTVYFNENLFPPPSWLDISNSTFFHLFPAPIHLVASGGFFFN